MNMHARTTELIDAGFTVTHAIETAAYELSHPPVSYRYSTAPDGSITATEVNS